MNRNLLTAIASSLLFSQLLYAQEKNENNHRLTFSEWGAFYSNGSNVSNVGTQEIASQQGNTVGLMAYWSVPYKDYDDNDLVLGWNFNVAGGWNLPKSRAGRYNLDIGVWSSKLINNKIEIGAQYSFLGVYCYQNISFLGSSIQAAMRVANFQLTYSREGEGLFTGWIKPKYQNSYANSIGGKYFFGKKFFGGGRLTKYSLNKEYAIAIGVTGF